MAKEELLELDGIVDEVLPDSRYRVTLDNGVVVGAYASGRMRKNHIRILAGDRVTLELSVYDLTKDGSTSVTRTNAPPVAAAPAIRSSVVADHGTTFAVLMTAATRRRISRAFSGLNIARAARSGVPSLHHPSPRHRRTVYWVRSESRASARREHLCLSPEHRAQIAPVVDSHLLDHPLFEFGEMFAHGTQRTR